MKKMKKKKEEKDMEIGSREENGGIYIAIYQVCDKEREKKGREHTKSPETTTPRWCPPSKIRTKKCLTFTEI